MTGRPTETSEAGYVCLGCLLEGRVHDASTMRVGTALCELHADESNVEPLSTPTRCRRCEWEGKLHRAWTIRFDQPICVFHAIDDAFPGDDMREHDLYALIYEDLRKRGHPDAF